MNIYPHRIRLRGPWECELLDGPTAGKKFRVTMPCRWADLGPAGLGRARCRRRFGYPGQIDTYERVWLTFAGLSRQATLSLNGALLGEVAAGAEGELDVTELLQSRNELVVDLDAADQEVFVWYEAALEVRCTAFLRGVTVRGRLRDGRGEICVAGEVVGQADSLLDLYVILGRSPLAETRVAALPKGQVFRLTVGDLEPSLLAASDPETGEPVGARVELVNGAVVWYSWQTSLAVEAAAGR